MPITSVFTALKRFDVIKDIQNGNYDAAVLGWQVN